jgi:hypothetical protein
VAPLEHNAKKGHALRGRIDLNQMLYLEASDWRAADETEKYALASTFMRVFCTDLRMPPSALVACLDSDGDQGRVYERAIACIEKAAGRS